MTSTREPAPAARSQQVEEKLVRALERLEGARPFAKGMHQQPVLDLARRLLVEPDGVERLARLAPRFDLAGLFAGTDWDEPATLLPHLVSHTLDTGERATVVLECLSELRLLAIAQGRARHRGVHAEQARHLLTQVLALNLGRLFGTVGEADRERLGALGDGVSRMFRFLLDEIGFEDILGSLIDEVWRVLAQRPIQVGPVKAMITQIAATLVRGAGEVREARLGADRLISALFGPTQGCLDDPGVGAYVERVGRMDEEGLQREAHAFARAMHDTGLVSDYHASFLRWLSGSSSPDRVGDALGLSGAGREALRCHAELVQRLIRDAVHPQTAQAVYGLAMLLESGVLFSAPVAPALWRQVRLELSPNASATIAALYGEAHPPRVFLLAGVLSLLGQPLGVGQGNNPSCQSARALCMWSLNDPDYLLHLLAQAARRDSVSMHFEGRELESSALPPGLLPFHPLDADPVSTLLVPHLDRVYAAMGSLCAGRGEDPHRWINPEFHGWWVGRDFAIAVDVATGALREYPDFVGRFFRYYHPDCNGGNPMIHPQPAGLAVTDASGEPVGWHAITLLRVAPDPEGEMRVYFYNPNNDSGQDWGRGVVVSTQGRGERAGEASLPFAELASRLYIFHYDADLISPAKDPSAEEIEHVVRLGRESWATGRTGAGPGSHQEETA